MAPCFSSTTVGLIWIPHPEPVHVLIILWNICHMSKLLGALESYEPEEKKKQILLLCCSVAFHNIWLTHLPKHADSQLSINQEVIGNLLFSCCHDRHNIPINGIRMFCHRYMHSLTRTRFYIGKYIVITLYCIWYSC